MTFLLADFQEILTKVWRIRSMFSGVLSEGSLPEGFLFAEDTVSCFSEVSHPQQYSTATRDTVVVRNIEVPTKYLLSHDRIVVFEICLQSESPALHGNWNALRLARRALKDKFPTPMVPLTAVLPNHQVFLRDPVEQQLAYKMWDMWCHPLTVRRNLLYTKICGNFPSQILKYLQIVREFKYQ